jgi:hypothetical protein
LYYVGNEEEKEIKEIEDGLILREEPSENCELMRSQT